MNRPKQEVACVTCAHTIRALTDEFGEDAGGAVLWNATCYPFGHESLGQAYEAVFMHRVMGWSADRIIEQAELDLDRDVTELAAREKAEQPPAA